MNERENDKLQQLHQAMQQEQEQKERQEREADEKERLQREAAAAKERRKVFQLVKSWSNDRFWRWMSWLHSQAYEKAIEHVTYALESTQGISKAKVTEVLERTKTIREEWDGMPTVTIDNAELIIRADDGRLRE